MALITTGMGVQIEGDFVPFPMTSEQRRDTSENNARRGTCAYDNVQLFRAKTPLIRTRVQKPHAQTRTCHHCGSEVKVKKKVSLKPRPEPKQKWWLYYAPNHMTGGFPTKREAMAWYLKDGR